MAVSVKNFSGQVRLGDSQTSGSLTIYPLYPTATAEDSAAQPEPYLLLAEVLGHNNFVTGEILKRWHK